MSSPPRFTLASSVSLVMFMTGCVVVHRDRNAPGDIDIAEMPRRPEVERVETPEDPGERVVRVAAGPFMLIGPLFPQRERPVTARLEVGGELTLAWYDLERSHRPDPYHLPGMKQVDLLRTPHGTRQINLGLSIADIVDDETLLPGPAYVEYQQLHVPTENPIRSWGWMAGYGATLSTLRSGELAHGPQVGILGLGGMVYARAAWRFHEGATISFGYTYKLPLFFFVHSQ